jgi:large subunit ribosomal protein L6
MSKNKKITCVEIDIPKEIDVSINEDTISVKKGENEIKREFPGISFEKKDNSLLISKKRATKREIKHVNTIVAHVKNMFKGVQQKFKYELQICSVHFPMNVSVQGCYLHVKNFLGESGERKAKLLPGVDVNIEKDKIIVESNNIESAGQTAANIESATKVRGKDKRIFQDGIYIINKAGREM